MGKTSYLHLSVFVLFAIVWIAAFNNYKLNAEAEFESARLQVIIDDATDSAVREAVTNEQVTFDAVTYQPEFASETFIKILLTDFDMADSEAARTRLYRNISALALIANDGVYMGYPRRVYNRIEFHWEPKVPYAYSDATGNTLHCFKITDNYRASYAWNGTSYTLTEQRATPAGWGSLKKKVILNTIIKGFNEAAKNSAFGDNKLYIPEELSNYNVNDIHGVTLMAMVQDVDYYSTKPISYLSISGTQTKKAERVVCYTRAGVKVYCWEEDYDGTGGVERTFDTAFQAAEAGYVPDLVIFAE